METPKIKAALADPTVSYWLKDALRSAMQRDCVDALCDARMLHRLLDDRLKIITTPSKDAAA